MVTGDLFKNLLKGKTIAVGAIVSFLISYSLVFGFLCDRQITGFKAYYPFVFILVWAAAFLLCFLLWALIDRINLKVSKKDEKAEEVNEESKEIGDFLCIGSTYFFRMGTMPPCFVAWILFVRCLQRICSDLVFRSPDLGKNINHSFRAFIALLQNRQ